MSGQMSEHINQQSTSIGTFTQESAYVIETETLLSIHNCWQTMLDKLRLHLNW
jgi:hypothetical protein